jgi:amino acid adenylation domain-containing protein
MTAILGDLPASSLVDLPRRWSTGEGSARLAIVDGDTQVTYGRLNELAIEVQRSLEHVGIGPGHRVAILAEKGISVIAGFLGSLSCGATYIPLDPRTPVERAVAEVDQAEASIVLAPPSLGAVARAVAERCRSVAGHGVLTLEGCRVTSGGARPSSPAPAGEAYVFFTSGSSGWPKGVSLSHANALAFVDWAVGYFGLTPGSAVGGYNLLSFDLSVFDLYATFAAGATLHLVPYGPAGTWRPTLWPFVVEHGISHWLSVPGALALLARDRRASASSVPRLRELVWCGEAAPAPAIAALMARLPHVRFTNLYGPTETTTASTFHSLSEPPDGPIPIGRPLPGEELIVLDDRHEEAAVGERGELCVGGVGVSRGYVGAGADDRPFVTRQHDGRAVPFYRTGDIGWKDGQGLAHFVGRRDGQVKVRGYRVEPGDVEASLVRVPGVRQAAVVAVPGRAAQGTVLCAAVVPDDLDAASPEAMGSALADHVPPYMVPTRWALLADLPRTSRGKVDRNAVQAAFAPGDRRDRSTTEAVGGAPA